MELVGSVIKDVSVLRRMLFAASYLPQDVPHYWEIVASFSCVNSSISLSADRVKLLMENLQLLSRQAFATDAELTAELLKTHRVCPKSKSEVLGVALISDKQTCCKCGGRLLMRQDRPSRVILYTESMGTVPASHYHKYCQNHRRGCKTTQFYGYVKEGDKDGLKYDTDWEKHAYILSSQETGFELSMLQKFDAELLIGQVSYKQKAEIYNVSHGYDTAKKEHKNQSLKSSDNESTVHEAPTDVSEYCSTLTKRQSLDRRRFEAAHLRYAVLKVAASYPELMGTQGLLVYPDVEKTLQIITPALYSSFQARFSAHNCKYPGCGVVLVLDGNMKNRRDVCYAKDAGYVEFDGLSGSIKTGCQATPAYKSRYCEQHKPFACDFTTVACDEEMDTSDLDGPIGSTLRNAQRNREPGEDIVEIILAKKVTRRQTYYKVAWLGHPDCKATWEPASILSSSLVADYEAGIQKETITESATTYGHISSTLVTKNNSSPEPPAKKPKVQDSNEQNEQSRDTELMCRTEKDRGVARLNHRTAGILAGIWPCGIITLISELFISESKTQVYGYLHSYLQDDPRTAERLKFICYDDGCHLKKYACNPTRRDQTDTAKKLADMSIVIDKMHMAGHIDNWCKRNCDPKSFKELNDVDTEVCEQTFSWLSRYGKMTRKMNRHTYMFFIIYLCDLHNEREIQKLSRSNFL